MYCGDAREEGAILQQFFTRKCGKGRVWGEGMRQAAEDEAGCRGWVCFTCPDIGICFGRGESQPYLP